jgi:hypothetical protein
VVIIYFETISTTRMVKINSIMFLIPLAFVATLKPFHKSTENQIKVNIATKLNSINSIMSGVEIALKLPATIMS